MNDSVKYHLLLQMYLKLSILQYLCYTEGVGGPLILFYTHTHTKLHKNLIHKYLVSLKPFSKPLPDPCPNPSLNPALTISQTLAQTLGQMEICMLESDWLIPHHAMPNSKFLPITAYKQVYLA